MAPKTGTFAVADLLAAKNTIIGTGDFSAQAIADALRQDNENYNLIIQQAIADLVETSTDVIRPVASSIGGDMMEVDEFSRGPTQKDTPGYFIGFPLRKFQFAVGWTAQWERNATVADAATKNLAAQAADIRNTRYQLQKAIFTPTNYTFNDINVNPSAALPVKAFINADSTAIQNGPNGEVFDGTTHTHYDGSATLTAAAVQAAINDVVEHRAGAQVRIAINQADVAAFQALTGFIRCRRRISPSTPRRTKSRRRAWTWADSTTGRSVGSVRRKCGRSRGCRRTTWSRTTSVRRPSRSCVASRRTRAASSSQRRSTRTRCVRSTSRISTDSARTTEWRCTS
jgi:hypothetical protein